MILLTGQFITSGLKIEGKKGKFLNIIIISKKLTFNKPVNKSDPKRVTKIGIKKSSSLVISMMIIAAEKVLVKADKKVAVPHKAKIPGWTLKPISLSTSPNSLPNIAPIIKAGVMIPLGIAKVVSINKIQIHIKTIENKWNFK